MSDEQKVAATVVTAENLAEFNAQKLGLAEPTAPTEAAPEAEASAEPVAEETPSEPPVAEGEATAKEERKQNPKIERRFSEITKQREEARAEARKEREAREALEARLKAIETQATPQKAESSNEKPKPENFTDAFEYAEALASWTAEQTLAKRDREELERRANEQRQLAVKAWADRVTAAKSELPDFDDMVQSSDVVVTDPIHDAIMESDVGPKILYHLAENPEFAQKLNGMSVISALREIGKLEARYETKPQSKPSAAVKSNAPEPITPIKAASTGRDVEVDSNGEFRGTYAQWKAARQAGRIR
jgi:hypothetical protein